MRCVIEKLEDGSGSRSVEEKDSYGVQWWNGMKEIIYIHIFGFLWWLVKSEMICSAVEVKTEKTGTTEGNWWSWAEKINEE